MDVVGHDDVAANQNVPVCGPMGKGYKRFVNPCIRQERAPILRAGGEIVNRAIGVKPLEPAQPWLE